MNHDLLTNSRSAELLEAQYEAYLDDPTSVSASWRSYFAALEDKPHPGPASKPAATGPATPPAVPKAPSGTKSLPSRKRQIAVLQLINAYRFSGHRRARLDPLGIAERPPAPDLDLAYHRLDQSDLERVYDTGSLVMEPGQPLAAVLEHLKAVYCETVGAEYMHLTDTTQKRWIQQHLEGGQFIPPSPMRRHVLERLVAATGIEEYLHTKYVGQKRFSLEGGESLVPLLDGLIEDAGAQGIREAILGMAHRGRLNVLVNILGKSPRDLFQEFEGQFDEASHSGDVKYHKGFSSDVDTPGGPMHLALAFNPSHLEIINPVVEGSVRARQQRRGDHKRNQVLPVLIHGDAALSGQGVVMETLNLSQTRGYSTGGTVHIVINNQIGFTTSEALDSRSTFYCTDVAKMIQAPIFHVNGDDPDAVVRITRIALAYRMAFNKDVVIDLVCYRRHGHSEADEPSVTQPLMYRAIRKHPKVRDIYRDRLMAEGVVDEAAFQRMTEEFTARVESGKVLSRPILNDYRTTYAVDWNRYVSGPWNEEVDTTVSRRDLGRLLTEITVIPEGFKVHPAVQKVLSARRAMAQGERALDWGAVEMLAYATLLENGFPVRLSGQDSSRGTFFHRHAVLHHQETNERYLPLRHLAEKQPQFLVIDSLLSEAAVLGFEVGYSAADPETLVIWEAQFGDFANNAQVVIDQFISSSEVKWRRYSGLVMLLPHGYDGQGPEHSSARLERYLQLCAENNLQVCYPSVPAQMFHMLRRQMLRHSRRPLIVMSPKSLLRHKLSVSSLDDLAERGFRPIIDEVDQLPPEAVRHILLCSGKVYFDLLTARREQDLKDTVVVRIEQLYPFPEEAVVEMLDRYPNAVHVRWVQEEPWNQGAWFYMYPNLKVFLSPDQGLDCTTRPPSASPAVGYYHIHLQQQQQLVAKALDFSGIERGARDDSQQAPYEGSTSSDRQTSSPN
ncbi:MAG: 2-oxoglutarate dehydrogenase E1 component [Gammaproteobacteria bacterium]|nr:2-oxoglutarate dehydrogenase E1 component [Gammaproteobacteria bacterium]